MSQKTACLKTLLLSLFLGISFQSIALAGKDDSLQRVKTTKPAFVLPKRGLCAHRGAMETHPENTISAFRAAVRAGAQMIEFDVWLTKDNEMVVLHDATVNRTTNGRGKVSDFTLTEIKRLDAGSWKAPEFAGEQIPTLQEVLHIMPYNIWLNIHIKGDGKLPVLAAELIAKKSRLHQAFLACGVNAAQQACVAVPGILICNMERMDSPGDYISETIKLKTDFIQLRKLNYPDFAVDVKKLKDNGIRINYFGTNSPDEIKILFENGVDFPLVNDIVHLIDIVKKLNISILQSFF